MSSTVSTEESTRLLELADRYGTPLFVYDGDVITRHAARLLGELAYRPLRVYYSAKATGAVGLASFMRTLGFGIDACSPGDLRLAELAQFPYDDISYTGFGATDEEFVLAHRAGATLILDDVTEIDRLARQVPGRDIGLRINPGIDAGFHPHVMAGAAASKFGIPAANAMGAAMESERCGLAVRGLHGHLGSDVLEAESHGALLECLAEIAAQIGSVTWLNIGGGFGTPRDDSTQPYPWETLSRHAERYLRMPDGRQLELRLEPGGYLSMDAGVVMGRVVGVKSGGASGSDLLVTDLSTNQLASVLLYDAIHPARLVGESVEERPYATYRVAGNLMQAADVVARDVRLPQAQPGDCIVLGYAGAYAASRATTFNQRPRPAEVLTCQDATILLRRAETLDDLFARDVGGGR